MEQKEVQTEEAPVEPPVVNEVVVYVTGVSCELFSMEDEQS